MKPSEILRGARKKIERPSAWARGNWARSADGFPVTTNDALATAWCTWGALNAACNGGDPTMAAGFLMQVAGARNLEQWSDAPERTHAEVLAAFDRAIGLAESLGQ